MKDYKKIINSVVNSEVMKKQWLNYQKDFEYAKDIPFSETCNAVMKIMDELNTEIIKCE